MVDSSNLNNIKENIVLKYTINGFIFGFFFPLLVWSFFLISDKYSFNFEDIKLMHTNNSLLYVINLAPFIISFVVFFIAGNVNKNRLFLIEQINKNKIVIAQYSKFAKQIAEDDFSEKEISSSKEELDRTLLLMKKNFIEKHENETKINWVTKGKENIADILRKNTDFNISVKETLTYIIEYTGSIQGSFYFFDDETQKLKNIFSYAYGRKKHNKQEFSIGEGLIGQAAYERDYIYRENLPNNYFTIVSGVIGEKKPNVLLIAPLIGDDKIQGIIEITSLQKKYNQTTISFLNELKEIIGQTLFNFKANLTTKKLLEDAQKLTDRLQKNENELRENAKQMELTQVELEESNIELATKITEVETGQKRIHALLENASEVITIYDLNGIVQYVSPSVKTILGYEAEEMIGINRFDRGDKILQTAFDELIKNPNTEKVFEYQYTNKNKERVWLETRGRNLLNNPAIKGIIFNTRDITVRKEAETAQKLSSEMQSLSENSLDMIVRIDQVGNIYYANPMTENFIGIKSEKLKDKNINNVGLNPTIVTFFKTIVDKTNNAGEEIQEETIFDINDAKRIVQFNSIPEMGDDGLIRTFLFVVHDITEGKEIELEIEKKNKDITESINYAHRIQSAIVPDFNILKRYLPKSFIFFSPKDVVSGDLPWFFVKGDNIYIAAIDCTGHGVPGTLLSFIGYFSLNDIVNKGEKHTAGEILDELHFQVRKTLKQDSPDSKARDGMDIALLKINSKENIIEFAGAHNPLIHLRKGEVTRYKGDRKAVGGKPMRQREGKKEKNFTTHKINVEKNDKFFIFTDGFPDQIGGEDGRKYQAGRMQKEIIEKNNFSMKQYYDFFVSQFDDWKKGYKQIDDVLFIGIEI